MKEFDVQALWEALDDRRLGLGLSWRQVCTEAGVVASTVTRMGYGHSISLTNLVRFLSWLGETDLAPFIRPAP